MKAIRFVILSCFILSMNGVIGNTLESIFEQANKDYKAKNYERAVQGYEKVLAGGMESASLYYNLGNAYYKQNQWAAAILNYEKARKLSPGDDDIQFNLRLANSKIVDKIESVPELFFYRWWKEARSQFSADGWAMVSILLCFLFFVFLTLYLLTKPRLLRKTSFWLALVLLGTFGLSMTFAHQSQQKKMSQKEAIIFQPAVNVKSSPDDNSVDLFIIHEGTKVNVTDDLGDWYKVVIANGSVGWVKADVLKLI